MATESELSRDADAALAAVDARMIEAEKDARMVEALRNAFRHFDAEELAGSMIHAHMREALLDIRADHLRIYDRPCTASAKTEGK